MYSLIIIQYLLHNEICYSFTTETKSMMKLLVGISKIGADWMCAIVKYSYSKYSYFYMNTNSFSCYYSVKYECKINIRYISSRHTEWYDTGV